MTHGTISRTCRKHVGRIVGWGVLVLVILTSTGHAPASLAGWVTHPPTRCVVLTIATRRRRAPTQPTPAWAEARAVLWATMPRVVVHTVVLAVVLTGSAPDGWTWGIVGVPLLRWGILGIRHAWPRWGAAHGWGLLDRGLFRIQQMTLLIGSVLLLGRWMEHTRRAGGLAPGMIVAPSLAGRIDADGTYEITVGDLFVMRHRPVDDTDTRLFLLFARTIKDPSRPHLPPLCTQQWLADTFGVQQEHISRWTGYHQRGAWETMQGNKPRSLLSEADRTTILELWARHIWWSVAEATTQCQARGLPGTVSVMEDIGRDTGLLVVRRTLRDRFHLSVDSVRPKEDWLVERLLAQIDALQEQVTQGRPPTPEETLAAADVPCIRTDLGMSSAHQLEKTVPWGYRLQQILLGQWEMLDDETVRCPHCGSTQVRRKSRQPRMKRYLDAQGQPQEVAVSR